MDQINKQKDLLITEIKWLIYDENTLNYVSRKIELFYTIPGIIKFTAISIVSEMKNMGRFKKD